MNDAVLDLKRSFDIEKACSGNGDALALEQIWRDYDVRNAGFVFHRQEDEAFRSSWALACNDASCDSDGSVVIAF